MVYKTNKKKITKISKSCPNILSITIPDWLEFKINKDGLIILTPKKLNTPHSLKQ